MAHAIAPTHKIMGETYQIACYSVASESRVAANQTVYSEDVALDNHTTDTAMDAHPLGRFAMLPNEAIMSIFCFVRAIPDVCRLMSVCRTFHAMVDAPFLWRALYRALPSAVGDAVPDTWGKDWRWLWSAPTVTINAGCGTGIATYRGGCLVYHGEVVGGQPDGRGIMVVRRDPPVVEVIDSNPCGTPTPRVMRTRWIIKAGDRFEGIWSRGILARGRCSFTPQTGCHYEGQCENGRIQGRGRLVYPIGIYTGSWHEDERHGRGIEIHHDDRVSYKGDWKFNRTHGHGTRVWLDGGIYTGDWLIGERSGHGAMTHAGGDRYHGQWKYDKRHGYGIEIRADGGSYQGGWWDGLMHGHGICISADGSRHEGEYHRGERCNVSCGGDIPCGPANQKG